MHIIGGNPERPILDRVQIPVDRVRDIYAQLDSISAAEPAYQFLQEWRVWKSFHQQFPFLANKEVKIDMSNVCAPFFAVYGDMPYPKPDRLIKAVHDIDSEHLHYVIEHVSRMRASMVTHVDQYDFWTRMVNEIAPGLDHYGAAQLRLQTGCWICVVEPYGDNE